jgi:hypothetical protein
MEVDQGQPALVLLLNLFEGLHGHGRAVLEHRPADPCLCSPHHPLHLALLSRNLSPILPQSRLQPHHLSHVLMQLPEPKK